jgi:hypothetical protein
LYQENAGFSYFANTKISPALIPGVGFDGLYIDSTRYWLIRMAQIVAALYDPLP